MFHYKHKYKQLYAVFLYVNICVKSKYFIFVCEKTYQWLETPLKNK